VRWFRKKEREEEAPAAAAPPEAVETRPAAEEAEPSEKKPRRRRGTRGGRGRKKKTSAQPTAAVVEATEREEQPKPRRRRTPAPKSSLPKVKKEILVSIEVGEQRVAVLEDGQVVEVYLERPGRRSVAGNIYKGVVDNVLPGMEASFVEIGLEKNGFLYVDEIVVPELEGKRHGRKIQDLIQRGQEVLVQAVKDPMGTKGARLTTEISLPGRFLVFTPFGDGIGVSRRLDDAERDRLKALCKELELPEGGFIVRTAAEGASKEELAGDLALLQKLWATVKGRAARAEAPALVYQEAELPLRIIRDLFLRNFERVVVDHERTHRRIVGYLKRTSKELAARVELDKGAEPLMARHGVDEAVKSTLQRRVDLPSGGYLVFDYAEAFTVIDVNTGRFVGARGKASGARLEDTITKNNLEAVIEVVRQLRLRDIGGIIVIDFIDMANPKNRHLVEEALNRELERDRTKTYVVEISPLGLVEMTRQNVTDGPREILTDSCPTCDGEGVVVSTETYAVDAERRMRALVATSKSEAFLVELNAQVAGILIGPSASRLDELEKETGRRFAIKTRPRVSPSHFAVLEEGPAAKIDPQAFPVTPGQELELTLEETHLHEDEDAIARLNGYVITVAGAGDSVGKKVKVRIEHAGRTSAHAVLAGEPSADGRPEAEPAEAAEDEAAPKPKRKTRRGSRGGRGRRKKTTSAAGAASESKQSEPKKSEPEQSEPEQTEPEPEGEAPAADAPVEEKPKKKTRRGTRGGRRRRKSTAKTAAEPSAEGGAAEFAAPEDAG
jgi:ribonuclease G